MRSILVVVALVLTAVFLLIVMPSPSRSAGGAGSSVHEAGLPASVVTGCRPPQQASLTAVASTEEQLVVSGISGILRDAQERALTVEDDAVASQLTPLYERAVASRLEDCLNQQSSKSAPSRVVYIAGDHACPPELLEEMGGELELDPAVEEAFEATIGDLFYRAFEEGREPTEAEVEAALRPYMDKLLARALESLGDCLPELPEDN